MFSKKSTIFFALTVILTFAWYTNQADAQYVKDGLLGYWPFDANTQ